MNKIGQETIHFLEQKKQDLIEKFEKDMLAIDNTIQLLKEEALAEPEATKKPVGRPKAVKATPAKEAKKPAKTTRKTSGKRKPGRRKSPQSIPEQIKMVISKARRFMNGNEIMEILSDEKKMTDEEAEKLKRYLTNTLSILKREGQLVAVRDKNEKRQKLYGLPEWMDEQGEAKESI